MLENGKESSSQAAIGRFVGRRPTLEWMEAHVRTHWSLSQTCLISLTEKGHFLFQFPLTLEMRKLILISWSVDQGNLQWPLSGLDFLVSHIIVGAGIYYSLAGAIGQPISVLNEITASQRIITHACTCYVNLDINKPRPKSIKVFID